MAMFEMELKTLSILLAIVLLTIILGTIVNKYFTIVVRRSTDQMKNSPTNYKFLRHMVVGLVYVIGFSIAIYSEPSLRTLANSLLAGAGILAVAVGFAAQQALSNIISGIFIVLFKPFRINDRLKINNLTGIVEDITLRHTIIKDFENKRVIIPNSVIGSEVLINSDMHDERACKFIDIGISYDSDIDLAKKIMEEEVLNHPLHIDPRSEVQIENGDPEVPVRVLSLGEYSVNLRAWAWSKDWVDGFVLSCDLFESIKKKFDEKGIEIPFPYRTIVYKEDMRKE